GAALCRGTPTQLGPHLCSPVGDGYFVTLDGPRNRNLRRPSQLLENARHMIAVVSDAEFTGQNFNDTRTGPALSAKTIGCRPVPEKIRNPPFLFLGQLGMRSMGPGQQGLPSRLAGARQPLAHRALGRSQGLGDVVFRPAMLEQVPSPKAAPFAPIVGLFHTSYCKVPRKV